MRTLLWIVWVALAATGCDCSTGLATTPVPEDALTPVKLPDVAPTSRKIVSLAPNLTEIVFALGAGDRVIGVGDFDTYPPEVAALPKVGGLLNPNLERILELTPDLVLLHASNSELADRLRKLGLRPVVFTADSIDEVYRVVLRLGQELGLDADARALVTGMKHELTVVAAPPDTPRPKVLIVVGRTTGTLQGLRSVGPGSFLDEIVVLAGGKNVADDTDTPWPELSKEAIVAAAPDVILELSPGATDDEATALAPWKALPNLPAVHNGHVRRLTADHLLIPGPRLVTTVRDVRTVLDEAR